MAVVAVGSIMRGSGVGMPSSRGEHVSLYPVVNWATVLGGLQEKERVVGEDNTFSNLSTGWAAEGTPQLDTKPINPQHMITTYTGIEQD